MKTSLLFAPVLLSFAPASHALTIDFGSGPSAPTICSSTANGSGSLTTCGNGSYLSQSYGDVAGVVDVDYSAPRLAAPTSLRWWDLNYNNLQGVAWADSSDSNSLARIAIKSIDTTALVTLQSFDLGAYSNTTRSTTVNVYAIGGGTPLYTFAGAVGNSNISANNFSPNVSAVGGLWLEWADSAYNVCVDNIQYSISAVPEPEAVVLMFAGLASLGVLMRRRKANQS
jgi:PEP-CTERM motif